MIIVLLLLLLYYLYMVKLRILTRHPQNPAQTTITTNTVLFHPTQSRNNQSQFIPTLQPRDMPITKAANSATLQFSIQRGNYCVMQPTVRENNTQCWSQVQWRNGGVRERSRVRSLAGRGCVTTLGKLFTHRLPMPRC